MDTTISMDASATTLDPMRPLPYRVRSCSRETHDTRTLVLEPPRGQSLAFAPGQFNMLYAFGVGEVPISISGDPLERKALVHTVRAVGATSRAICGAKPGQVLGVRGPFGSPWPVEQITGQDVLIVAGGIGLAPLRPAIYHLLAHRSEYGRIVLLYGARTPQDLLYLKELERWRSRFDLQVEVTVDSASGKDWLGNVGVVTTLIPKANVDIHHAAALVVGPEIMMRFALIELEKLGIPRERMYVSMERNMKCAIGHCGHCQYGPHFICKDGPVFSYARIQALFKTREV